MRMLFQMSILVMLATAPLAAATTIIADHAHLAKRNVDTEYLGFTGSTVYDSTVARLEVMGKSAASSANEMFSFASRHNFMAVDGSTNSTVNIYGNLSVHKDILHGVHRLLIRPGTGLNADNKATGICGGGEVSSSRGGYVVAYGNQFGSGVSGYLALGAGDAPDARINMASDVYCEQKLRAQKIIAGSIKVDADWPNAQPADYVFNDDYELKSLRQVEQFVKENKHLEGIPSAKEQIKDGIDVYKMMNKHLEKIEELTLYAIDADRKVDELAEENKKLREQMVKIMSRLERLESEQSE